MGRNFKSNHGFDRANKANSKSNSKVNRRGKLNKLKAKEPHNYQDLEVDDLKFKGLPLKGRKDITSNDPQWYFKDSNILNDVASYSFQTRLGSNYHLIEFSKKQVYSI